MSRIKIKKTNASRLPSVDFDNIPFGRIFSDHMFIADHENGRWGDFRIEPFERFSMHPATMVLHYGQAVFEGMKASKSHDGRALLLRPQRHAARLNKSAARMCMPAFPEDVFLEALHELVALDKDWIPPQKGSALYIRPFMFAMDEFIGVKPADKYRFIIFTGPVGPYYARPVSLWTEQEYVRAVNGGTGEAKAAGNYAASLLPAKKAGERGYDQVMWMDAHEFKYIEEVGTMNIFFVIDGKVITPVTTGSILRGITRDSVITILRDKGYTVEERRISIDEVVEASEAGVLQEVFGTGTAAVVAYVNKIGYGDLEIILPEIGADAIGKVVKREIDGLRAGTIEDTRGWIVPVRSAATVDA